VPSRNRRLLANPIYAVRTPPTQSRSLRLSARNFRSFTNSFHWTQPWPKRRLRSSPTGTPLARNLMSIKLSARHGPLGVRGWICSRHCIFCTRFQRRVEQRNRPGRLNAEGPSLSANGQSPQVLSLARGPSAAHLQVRAATQDCKSQDDDCHDQASVTGAAARGRGRARRASVQGQLSWRP
jgi:hypothetical protein